MSDIHQNKILILDFGSQYTQLIARRVREIGVYCELVSYDVNPHFIENLKTLSKVREMYDRRGSRQGPPDSTF